MALLSEVILLSLIFSAICDPAINNNNSRLKTRGLWDFFSSGKKEPVMGPCYSPTTTPAPLGPLCPLQEINPRPFESGIGPPPVYQLPPPPNPPPYPPPPEVPEYPKPPQYPQPPPPPPPPSYPPYPPPPPPPSYPQYPTYPPANFPPPPEAPPYPSYPAYPTPPTVPTIPTTAAPSHVSHLAEPSTFYPVLPLQSCRGVPTGPFIPPGYFLANNLLRQQQCMNQCPAVSRPSPQMLCNMMDVLQQLRLGTIYTLIQQAGLEQLFTQTSNYTFFAPVDPSFAKLPSWFLQSLRDDVKLLRAFILNHFIKIDLSLESLGNEYLVMNARAGGNRLRINVYNVESDYKVITADGARVLLGEIQTANGILHIVDKVLVPTRVRLHSEYLAEIQDFSAFLKAVVGSGLLPVLEDKNNPITLFVPYNQAFKGFDYAAISKDRVALQNFVNYHIVNGTYYSNGLLHGQFLTTNFLKEIKLSVSSDGFTKFANLINGNIRILKADIPVLNGVVHIIDTVLTYDLNFFTHIEMSEFSMEFGVLRRGMSLNKVELEKEFSEENAQLLRNATF